MDSVRYPPFGTVPCAAHKLLGHAIQYASRDANSVPAGHGGSGRILAHWRWLSVADTQMRWRTVPCILSRNKLPDLVSVCHSTTLISYAYHLFGGDATSWKYSLFETYDMRHPVRAIVVCSDAAGDVPGRQALLRT